uniref:JmjC domain-containing protein n=1 Tax=Panagrellus redivivus TaxID=6233 RepID=A0A7E4VQ66_PANRE
MEFAINDGPWQLFSDAAALQTSSTSISLKRVHFRWLETSESLDADYDELNNIVRLRNFESISTDGGLWLLPWAMFALRSISPKASICADLPADSTDSDLEDTFRRAGFILHGGKAVFPMATTSFDHQNPETSPNIANALDKLVKTEELCGRSILQEQYQPYVWRHCIKEPTFWGIIRMGAEISKHFDAETVFGQEKRESPLPKEASLRLDTLLRRIHSICDDHMNNQPFADVPQQYRQIYAMAAYERAKLKLLEDKPLAALNILDDGILKGIQFDDRNLSKFASSISKKLLPLPPAINSNRPLESAFPIPDKLQWSVDVKTEVRPSLEAFYKHCVAAGKPMVIKGMVEAFPIFEFFDFDYLNNTHGHRKVPIELGSSYTDDDYSQEIVSIHEYLSKHVFSTTQSTAYLAQHALLDQLNLTDTVPVPDYAAMLPNSEESVADPTMNVFIGPSGTLSPLHCDPRPNFFCQIRGKKFVRLVDRKHVDRVPVDPESMNSNSSIADFENPDYEEFPELVGLETDDIVLEAGDCLFMPERYFHLMRSLTQSISISIWC